MNESRVKSLLQNRYAFCPICNKNTVQQKVLNQKDESYCMTCGNILKITKPIIPEYNDELDIAIKSELPVLDEFDGWQVEELKEELLRLQDILDKNKVKY